MKATRANLLGEFTGKLDGLIYYRSRISGKLYVRRQWICKDHPAYPAFTNANRAIFALNPANAYIQNLKDYLRQYNMLPQNDNKPVHAWTNIYTKLMFAMQKSMPETAELSTITRVKIQENNLPCRNLKEAIEAGLLPRVNRYERFVAML